MKKSLLYGSLDFRSDLDPFKNETDPNTCFPWLIWVPVADPRWRDGSGGGRAGRRGTPDYRRTVTGYPRWCAGFPWIWIC